MDAQPPSEVRAASRGAAVRVVDGGALKAAGLASWAERVAELQGWRRMALAVFAGAVSVLAMAPFFLWPVLAVTLPVLVWMIDGAGAKKRPLRDAFSAGWGFGFGYFFAGLFWIGEAFLVEADVFAWLLPFAVTVMPAGLALFYGLAAAVARKWWRPGLSRVLVLAVALAAAEWLRGHILTGFPWNVLGYALTFNLAAMQMTSVLGIYGLTLWTVLALAAPAVLAADRADHETTWRALIPGGAILAATLVVLLGYGTARLSAGPAPMLPGVKLRIVQPSVPQREKWRPEKQREIFLDHMALSRRSASGALDDLDGVTHVVWAEAAMPFMPLSKPEALSAIGELLPDGTHLVAGALRIENATMGEPRRLAYNSLMTFDPSGSLVTLYDKIHLVPFGEYLPFQETLESIGLEQLTRMRGGFSIGPKPRPLVAVPGLPPVGGLICYEAIFPAAVVQGAARPGLLINVTNDGWFGNTTGPHQHFHQSRIRAVEEGLPLIRSANNGISAVFDAEGRILHRLELNQRGVIDSQLPAGRLPTAYSRLGDRLFWINTLLFLVAAFWVAGSNRRR